MITRHRRSLLIGADRPDSFGQRRTGSGAAAARWTSTFCLEYPPKRAEQRNWHGNGLRHKNHVQQEKTPIWGKYAIGYLWQLLPLSGSGSLTDRKSPAACQGNDSSGNPAAGRKNVTGIRIHFWFLAVYINTMNCDTSAYFRISHKQYRYYPYSGSTLR